jgi:predicted DNA repair protein MutK
MGSIVGAVTPTLMNFAVGILAGVLVVIMVTLIQKVWPKSKPSQ